MYGEEVKPCKDRGRVQLVCEIMALSYLINVYTSLCVFCDYRGHVDQLDIRVASSKKNWDDRILETRFYTRWREKYNEESYGDLKARRDILREVLKEEDVPYGHEQIERMVECNERYVF
jgi:hypothetical protein